MLGTMGIGDLTGEKAVIHELKTVTNVGVKLLAGLDRDRPEKVIGDTQ